MKLIVIVKHSWPVGIFSLPFGIVCYVLLCYFTDSIEAYDNMRDFDTSWGGIETLFALNAGVLGWGSIIVLERRVELSSKAMMLVSVFWSSMAIVIGFALASTTLGGLTDTMWKMLLVTLLFSAVACAIRSHF